MNATQQLIYDALSPAGRLQLADYIEYVVAAADPKQNPGGRLAEGSLQALYARQPEEVRNAIDAMDGYISHQRSEPFMPKYSEQDRLQELGIPIESGLTIKAAADSFGVLNGLAERMGTDNAPAEWQRDEQYLANHAPARASIASAIERHEPLRQLKQQVDNYTADSSEGLSLRETLETVHDTMAQMHPESETPPLDEDDKSDSRIALEYFTARAEQ